MSNVYYYGVRTLTVEQVEFIQKETGLSFEDLIHANEEECGKLYDRMCEIEIEEASRDSETISDRLGLAGDIVTTMGNYMHAVQQVENFVKFYEEYEESLSDILEEEHTKEIIRLVEWLQDEKYSDDDIIDCLRYISG